MSVLLTSGTVLLLGYLAWLWFGPREYLPVRDLLLYCTLLVTPALSFLARARVGGPTRTAWQFFATATVLWLVAEAGYVLTTGAVDTDPVAWVDWLFIIAPVVLYAAVGLLAMIMLPDATVDVWLDGLIITFASAAFATLFYPGLLDRFAVSLPDTIVSVTEPLTGLLLVSLIIAILSLTGAAAGTMWWLLLIGSSVFWLADLVWLFELEGATYANGALVDIGWPAGLLLMGLAAWAPMRRPHPLPQHGWALPLIITALAFGIILFATTQQTPAVTVVLAGAAVVVGGLRSLRAFHWASIRTQAQRQAVTDDLTGLANRRGLTEALEASIGQRALLLVDIDRFKQINDTLGHQAGDEVLQQVSTRLQNCVPDQAVVARIGGDEFAVLLPSGSEWSQAATTAECLHETVGPAVVASGIELQVEISVGIAFCPQHGTTISELLRTADRAIYRARRDRVGSVVFEPTWDSDDRGALLLMQELRKAVDRREFLCHYQPQLDVITDQVVAVESLVRWQHPQRGLIPADQFLPTLEQTALIRPLSDLVLDQSLAQLRMWDALGLDLRLSVNLSAANLTDRGLPLRVARMLADHHVPAPRLTLEITETALAGDPERVRGVLAQLHEIGVQVSIDDYGSGYSSLRQIGQLSAGELKLDRDFVTGVGQRGDLRSILSATVHLAHGLRLRMVAEGVESASDLDQVRLSGCDLAQGYFISPPRNADEFIVWLTQRAADSAHLPTPSRTADGQR